jgi:hypothetical protein
MRFTFHVGMGKTGSTAIQHALARSGAELAAAGIHYAGMWAPWIGPEHDGSGPFHRFLALPPERLRAEADRCLDWAEGIAAETGAATLLHSNEAFHAVPFFQRLAERAEVRLVAYVRTPARWLPSAYLQWGVVHKTNPGPVAPFAETGRRLMRQYRAIQALHAGLGDRLEMRAYPEGGDVLQDFGEVIGVRLGRPEGRAQRRLQERPGPVDTLLRASFNSGLPGPVLPHVFNEAMGPGCGRSSHPASRRLAQLLDMSEMPRIREENADLLAWFDRVAGLDLVASPEPSPLPDRADLADALLGTLVDLAAAQGREIAALKARLAEVEGRLAPT